MLGVTLLLLLAHAGLYRFTTDDAFISFRYARNLADGHGLVFNPGGERVEGYTNFLWVVLLAGGRLAGVEPETAATALSILATVGLWVVLAGEFVRRAPPGTPVWLVPLPLLGLAATRSFAVWSTSGLETRLFELWIVWGVLRLLRETGPHGTSGPPLSGLLFGLAALTRPEGLLLGACATGSAFALGLPRTRDNWRAWIARVTLFLGPVLAHLAFRLAYYGAWLPNTYHAKVGGRAWWDMGLDYVAAFGLEYGAWIWIPLLLAAAYGNAGSREGSRWVLVLAATLVPFVVYVAAIGGDHFEYRPLNLLFPFVFLLLGEGAYRVARRPRGTLWVALAAAAVLWGLLWIPIRSHRTFPAQYVSGFPGMASASPEARRFLDPAEDVVYRLPGLRSLAEMHRRKVFRLTSAFVAIRQEEHRAFLESLRPQAERLRVLVAAGRIPPDFHVAMSSVGLVPYASDLPTLDRLGLTDAWVARAPALGEERAMGHERRDTWDHARRVGVDLSSVRAATILFEPSDPLLLRSLASASAAGLPAAWAEIEPGAILAGTLPQGLEATRLAFPMLPFRPLSASRDWAALAGRCVPDLDAARREPGADLEQSLAYGHALLTAGRAVEALPVLESLVTERPAWVDAWKALSGARALSGDLPGARVAIREAIDAAGRAGDDTSSLEEIARRLDQNPAIRP